MDPETGKVQLLRYTAVQDVGKAIHPSYVEGQMQGGAAQGIGWALNEEYVYDAEGHMLNASFLDYRMPTALDLPMIDTVMVEVPNPGHPYGVRGVGEVPIVPPPGALANAIYAALGVRMACAADVAGACAGGVVGRRGLKPPASVQVNRLETGWVVTRRKRRMAVVWIPALYRDLTGGEATATVPGDTVRQLIENLEARYPGVKARLYRDDEERLRPGVAVVVDGVVIRGRSRVLREPLQRDERGSFSARDQRRVGLTSRDRDAVTALMKREMLRQGFVAARDVGPTRLRMTT